MESFIGKLEERRSILKRLEENTGVKKQDVLNKLYALLKMGLLEAVKSDSELVGVELEFSLINKFNERNRSAWGVRNFSNNMYDNISSNQGVYVTIKNFLNDYLGYTGVLSFDCLRESCDRDGIVYSYYNDKENNIVHHVFEIGLRKEHDKEITEQFGRDSRSNKVKNINRKLN